MGECDQLDLEWSLEQLCYLMNAKQVDGPKDIVRAEVSKGNIRGARAWKRIQGLRCWLDPEQAGGVTVGTEQLQAGGIFRRLDDCLGAQGLGLGALPAIRRHG